MALTRASVGRRRAVALVLAAWLATAFSSLAQDNTPDALRLAERSVVRVVTVSLDDTGQPVSLDTGSGFVVAPGKVVTNNHVVQGAPQAAEVDAFVIPDRDIGGVAAKASVIQAWADGDLAILSAPALTSPPMPIARAAPGKDATVHALGYPGVTDAVRNLSLTQILSPQEPYVTPGSIALFSAVAPGGKRIATIFHTAPINPGNSGGPLIDACGRVIGVNTWGAGAQLSDNGEVNAPQGQFVATRSSVLAQFLADAQVSANLVEGPCVPAADQTLQDRLRLDETAIAGQKDQLTRLQAQLQDAGALQHALSLWLGLVTGALAVLTIVLVAARFGRRRIRSADSQSTPPAASAPTPSLAEPSEVAS